MLKKIGVTKRVLERMSIGNKQKVFEWAAAGGRGDLNLLYTSTSMHPDRFRWKEGTFGRRKMHK